MGVTMSGLVKKNWHVSFVYSAAVKKNPLTSSASKDDIKDAVMTWLNGSRDRGKDGRQQRYLAASLK